MGIIENFTCLCSHGDSAFVVTFIGTYCGGIDRGGACGQGVFTGKGEYAGYRFKGQWENNEFRHGELKMKNGMRYVGDFYKGRGFHGHGELWLKDGVRCFDGQWMMGEEGVGGSAHSGMAVDSDGSVHRVKFEGYGVEWTEMERAFNEKQSFQIPYGVYFGSGCKGASWTLLPVVAEPPLHCTRGSAVTIPDSLRAAASTV
jgi:hypothetical protein